MRVVHISSGCVSGSPWRIVKALNAHTEHDAFHINTMEEDPRDYFDLGIDWRTQRDEAEALLSSADVIHSHSRRALKTLSGLIDPKVPVLLHHHGSPDKEECLGEIPPGEESLCHVSIAQYPERYVPRARILPNLVEFETKVPDELLRGEAARIFYSPTMNTSAWRPPERWMRWVTKAKPEIRVLLCRLFNRYKARGKAIHLNYLVGAPFDVCMDAKRTSNIVIDDTITGSYHLVGLEGLAMGIPVVGYIDSRIEYLLKSITGADSIPWVNVHLEELEPTLERLIEDGDLRQAIGDASYAWMQQYYREDVLIQHVSRAYKDLLSGPDVFFKNRFNTSRKRDLWFVRDSFDIQYIARKRKKQRGVGLTLWSAYTNHVASVQPNNDIISGLGIQENAFPLGQWFYTNRHKRIDGYSKVFSEPRRKSMLDKYRAVFPYVNGKRVAVLGSGTGFGVKLLKEEGEACSVVGVEKDMFAVACAEQEYACEGVSYVQKDVMRSGFSGESFDVVVAIDLIERVDCDVSLLDECKRLLVPGGVCVISGADFWDEGAEAYYLRRYTPASFKSSLECVFSSVALFRQPSFSIHWVDSFIPELSLTPLKEGESLLAICKK